MPDGSNMVGTVASTSQGTLKTLWRAYLAAWRDVGITTNVADQKAFAIEDRELRERDPEVCRLRSLEQEAQKKWEGLSEQMHTVRANTLEDLEIRLRHLKEAYLFHGSGEPVVRSIIRDLARIRKGG